MRIFKLDDRAEIKNFYFFDGTAILVMGENLKAVSMSFDGKTRNNAAIVAPCNDYIEGAPHALVKNVLFIFGGWWDKQKYSISLITKVMDLTTLHDADVYASFENEMLKQKISILFNNAGMSEEKKAFWNYAGSTPSKVTKIMYLNAEVPVLMTRMVLPGMLERKKGVLMHMGSSAGLTALDANPIYAGTKSHVINFSRSIEQLFYNPAFIRTSLTTFLTKGIKKKGYENTMEKLKDIVFPKVETWFASAIKTVGTGKNESGGSWFFEQFVNYMVMHFDSRGLKMLTDLSE
ncbi:Oidioi.mRNA.OKI2018_I69.PAR.g8450.t1.cds [Oikopleura dioica]|uniref:Oidioi.mRNA.OKI2018_I69.PAR.g8450.t1.cds n=1 Tax=Oikopleura dioica TaxID=34765 RepID=A0ABN7RJI4_OIKDI|nr:Oidioi.mRNA.OKI2018_I69.PAR.g8450.t1.cds [Oikopleura dioica]